MKNNYWNDIYWKGNLAKNKDKTLDFLSNCWLDKYNDIIDSIPKGIALDLGCGLGQYTKYLMDKGFDVMSADISLEALKILKKNISNAKVELLDMSNPLPFEDNSFDLVLANLSIHYFDEQTTLSLLREIRRILKTDGYFMGTVNSTKTLPYIKGEIQKLDTNYYYENGRYSRLWDLESFDYYFKNFIFKVLEEKETTRWNLKKVQWEFVCRK